MKKIIFIDWDGTLCWSKFWESLSEKNERFARVIADFFANEKLMIKDWMCGKYSSEEINKILSGRLGLPEEDVWRSFVLDCQNMRFDPETIELIQEVREKYTVVLITGNMDCFTRFTMPALKLNDFFDHIINSYDVGFLKTDNNGKSFFDCLNFFKVNISDAFLIEDSVNTCDLFARLGGEALRVKQKTDTVAYLKALL